MLKDDFFYKIFTISSFLNVIDMGITFLTSPFESKRALFAVKEVLGHLEDSFIISTSASVKILY